MADHRNGKAARLGEAGGHRCVTGGVSDSKNPLNAQASQIVDDLVSNGALFDLDESRSDGLTSFTYSIANGGDQKRCRQILRGTRSDWAIWSAFIFEVAALCRAAREAAA